MWSKKFKGEKALTEYDFGNLTLKPIVFKNFKKYGIAVSNIKLENIVYPKNIKAEEFETVEAEAVQPGEVENEDEKNNDSKQLLTSQEKNIDYVEQKPLMIEEEEKKIPFKSFEEQNVVCPKCGKGNPAGSKFCNECGTLIKQGE